MWVCSYSSSLPKDLFANCWVILLLWTSNASIASTMLEGRAVVRGGEAAGMDGFASDTEFTFPFRTRASAIFSWLLLDVAKRKSFRPRLSACTLQPEPTTSSTA